MANTKHKRHFYNEYQKQRFLNTVPSKNEYEPFHLLLGRVGTTEEIYGKDLYDFSLPEIERFLIYLKPNKFSVSQYNINKINRYINWANEQHLRQTNINPLQVIGIDDEYIRKFIDPSKKTLFTSDEIEYMIAETVNAQDKALISLIFEGVVGKNCAELCNLQYHNIDFDNLNILLTNKNGSTRIIGISNECINHVDAALKQTEYIKKNGQVSITTKSPINQLAKSNYVLKNSIRGNNIKMNQQSILQRLNMLREYFEERYFTLTNIRDSGMLKMAADLYFESGKLDKEEYEVIWKQFNLGTVINNGEETINYFPYRKRFLNTGNVEKLYGK
jgi:integrase